VAPVSSIASEATAISIVPVPARIITMPPVGATGVECTAAQPIATFVIVVIIGVAINADDCKAAVVPKMTECKMTGAHGVRSPTASAMMTVASRLGGLRGADESRNGDGGENSDPRFSVHLLPPCRDTHPARPKGTTAERGGAWS
jgi:hypothetical protein